MAYQRYAYARAHPLRYRVTRHHVEYPTAGADRIASTMRAAIFGMGRTKVHPVILHLAMKVY